MNWFTKQFRRHFPRHHEEWCVCRWSADAQFVPLKLWCVNGHPAELWRYRVAIPVFSEDGATAICVGLNQLESEIRNET